MAVRSASIRYERPRVRELQPCRVVAMDAAGEQQATLRMVEDNDGVEDPEPLAREIERIARGARELLIAACSLVCEEAHGAAEQWRCKAGSTCRPERRYVTVEDCERILAAARRHGSRAMARDRASTSAPRHHCLRLNSSRKQLASVPSARIAATGVASPIGSSRTTATTSWSVSRRRVSSMPGSGCFIDPAPWRDHPGTPAPTYCAIRRAASSRLAMDAA